MRTWLKTARKNAKMTQEQIASCTGIARTFYTRIESGKRNPHVETAKKIAEVLNFDWIKFFEDNTT